MKEKYLPLGTVVILKDAQKKLMITGYCINSSEKDGKTYDYCGCIFPEGTLNSSKTFGFQHSQIEKIYFTGYKNEESTKFLNILLEQQKEKDKEQGNQDLILYEEFEDEEINEETERLDS